MLSTAYSMYILSNQIHFPLPQLHNHDDNSSLLATPLKLLSLIHKLYSLLLLCFYLLFICVAADVGCWFLMLLLLLHYCCSAALYYYLRLQRIDFIFLAFVLFVLFCFVCLFVLLNNICIVKKETF